MEQNNKNLVQRQIFPEVVAHLEKPEISVIVGPRQSGKTTLLGQIKDYLLKKGHKPENILIFNLDILTELELFSSQQKFISFLKERVGKEKLFVFVDEAQRVENAGIFFKGIYDIRLPVKFILTGSSVLELKAKIHESLTGRKRVFYLYPFSFSEYLGVCEQTIAPLISATGKEISSYTRQRIMEHFFSFIVWGGYPKISLETNVREKEQELKEIFSSYIERDIVGFMKIRNYSLFSNSVLLLAAQTGQLFNINALCKSLRTERKTLEKYLDILEKTFILKRISPFFRNQRKEITKMPKVYFVDSGLRNFALKSFQNFEIRQDRGALLENFVFSEVLKQSDEPVYFWRTKEKAEVDFILKGNRGEVVAAEVKAAPLKSPEISRSLRSFIERYHLKKAFIINLGFQGQLKLNKTSILFILPYEIDKILVSEFQ